MPKATPAPRYTASHWGIYEVGQTDEGAPRLLPLAADPAPSPIGLAMLDATRDAGQRIHAPHVRRGWLTHGPGHAGGQRGDDTYVEVSWDQALDLVAGELQRVRREHGNEAIFAGSYGWSSAGRFHHAQSHIHRFFNCLGGYVRHVDTYSLGAARVVLPHIIAPMESLMAQHTSWDVLAEHTRIFLCFGGLPAKNAQVTAGGAGPHRLPSALRAMHQAGTRFINVSPVRDDIAAELDAEWLAIRPNSDTALLLGLAHTLLAENRHDQAFLASHCHGFEQVRDYLLHGDGGQPLDARWAAGITGLPAERIVRLARELAATRSMINMAWSLQRAEYGEQPYWALITLAAMLGQIGLPGGGFGVGYGAINAIGSDMPRWGSASLPQGRNPVRSFIPVARITDMLERPGDTFDYDGQRYAYPHIRLIYWAGGNPYHHHQDLNRLRRAWQRPDTVIAHEQFWTANARHADIVLPATTTLEREDIGFANLEPFLVAMSQVIPPEGQARDDYAIFSALAGRLGVADAYTEGLDAQGWLRRLYASFEPLARDAGIALPDYDGFWRAGMLDLRQHARPQIMLAEFRAAPQTHPLATPSGRIQLFSESVAAFGYPDCTGQARWHEPQEWLGQAAADELHLLSDQPATKLHSQLDHSAYSRAGKRLGREPLTLHPSDAAQRGIEDGMLVLVQNARGRCLAAARISDDIRPGVVRLSTGAWFDPEPGIVSPDAASAAAILERHGNPNVLTRDAGCSSLSQGCAAQSCLVRVSPWHGPVQTHQMSPPPKQAPY